MHKDRIVCLANNKHLRHTVMFVPSSQVQSSPGPNLRREREAAGKLLLVQVPLPVLQVLPTLSPPLLLLLPTMLAPTPLLLACSLLLLLLPAPLEHEKVLPAAALVVDEEELGECK